jgi:enamine deaminase RidA (YjgF/YER057c/UK114 family)
LLMKRPIAGFVAAAAALASLSVVSAADKSKEIIRYENAGATPSPIARAIEVPGTYRLVFHSGLTPQPADPKAQQGTPEYWGNTKTQSLSVLSRLQESVKSMGLTFGDVVKMTVFLGGDPATGGRMDFAGFMEAYSQYFGTKDQPNRPARSTVQVASLVQPGMLVEIEVVLAKPGP